MDTKQLKKAIENRDVSTILSLFFEGRPLRIRAGIRREDPLWDFKESCPPPSRDYAAEWAQVAADVMAFHNAGGGVIVFGISDDYEVRPIKHRIDSKLFNDQIRGYVGDTLWVPFNRETCEGGYVGIAVVQPRGTCVLRALRDAPTDQKGRRYFGSQDICVREGDQTRVYRGEEAQRYLRENSVPTSSALYLVDEPAYRILRPEYQRFVRRERLETVLWKAIDDPRCYVLHLTGFGGVGKTALALWFALELYEKKRFEFIVSASARDRALTTKGITEVAPTLTSYEEMLTQISTVLGFSKDLDGLSADVKEQEIIDLLKGTNALIVLDNLETVDDERIVEFVEKLPLPVRAIITARKQRVQKSVYPVTVGPLEPAESLSLIGQLVEGRGREDLEALSLKERELIANRCLHVPLAIEWVIGRASSASEAMDFSRELERYNANTDELLEFSFRRVHKDLGGAERSVLNALAIFENPQPLEALSAAADLPIPHCEDAIETLKQSHLILERKAEANPGIRLYDANTLVKRFCYVVLSERAGQEATIRRKLSGWYDALDIRDPDERGIVSQIRKGKRDAEMTYVELGVQLRKQGHYDEA
ncbi:MAG: hypothetical protein FJ279_09705, partial [Planctomycetes bacterium]|nr:hypothetical protein [Planctomycetota bacterium]